MTLGFRAEASRASMHEAALALLLGEEMPVEPMTGQPFFWDPSTRMLSPPPEIGDSDFVLEPITLP